MTRVLPVLVVLFFVLGSSFFLFQSKNVEITPDQACVTQEALKKTVVDKNLLFLNEEKLRTSLKEKFPCIDQVIVKKALPNKMVFEVKTDEPIAKIEGTNLYLTKNALIASDSKNQNLPTLYLPGSLKVTKGQKVNDPNLLFALGLLAKLSKSDFAATQARFLEDGIAVYNQLGTVALFSVRKSQDEQVDSLQQVLAQAKIDAEKITKIDLRFNKPIVLINSS